MVPALAKVINPGLAAQLARQMNIPVFRKREARALGVPGGAEYFTNAEMAELRGIDSSPAIREYMMLKPKVREAVQSTIRGWSEDFAFQLNKKALDAIGQVDKDLMAARDAHEGRTIKIGSIGFEPWDQLIYAVGSSMIKFSNAFLHLENSLKQLRYEEYFRAENLASRKHLENANAVIDKVEVALETTLKEFNDAIKEREDSVAKSAFASKPEFRKDMDEGLGKLYAFAGDYSESARNMLAQHRQLIAFMQARVDKVSLKDGNLIFATEEELKQAQEILDKLDSARTALQEILKRQRGSENDTMRNLRAEAEKRHG